MKLQDIYRAIDNGDFDADLAGAWHAISTAFKERIKARRQVTDAQALLDIKIGDTVRFNNDAHPVYLRGLKAKVVGKKGMMLVLDIEKGYGGGKFAGMKGGRSPVSLVEKVA